MSAKEKLGAEGALELTGGVNEIYSTKGKKIAYVYLRKDKPDKEAILGLMLGPTGNLRAPVVRKGKTLIVGFNEEVYSKVFK